MSNKLNITYDEKADYLELFIDESRSNYGEELKEGVTLFRDEKSGTVIGLGVLRFRERSRSHGFDISLPFDLKFMSGSKSPQHS